MNELRSRTSPTLVLACILLLGLGIRLAFWMNVRAMPFINHPIMDSAEYDRWGQAVAAGDWLGSGVFFQAPLYPYLLGSLYAVFGRHLDLIYLLQILISGLTMFALYRAGRLMIGPAGGLAAAFLAGVYAPFAFYEVQLQKEPLAILLVSLLLWNLASLRRGRGRPAVWLVPGLILGILSLLRENALVVVPFLLPLALWKGESKSVALRRSLALIGGLALALLPVTLRNGLVGGSFLPTTFNSGVSFYIGNHAGANGTYVSISPGKQIPYYERAEPVRIAELESGRPLSPAAVSDFWMRKALSWAAAHPVDFLALQVKKLGMFWSWYEWPDAVDYYYLRETSGVLGFPLLEFGGILILAAVGAWAVRSRWRDLLPVWLFGLGWMVSIVVFFVFARYRIPIVPPLLILGGGAAAGLIEAFGKRRLLQALVVGTAIVLAFAVPLIRPYAPKWDLVHYNLGVVAQERGDPEKAIGHFEEALRANPQEFLALVNLGNIAASRRDWSGALARFEQAAAIEPLADGVWVNIGRVQAAAGDLEKAEATLDKALEINPRSFEALHNKSVIAAMRGDLEAARSLNRRALELSPGWPPAVEFGRKLERMAEF